MIGFLGAVLGQTANVLYEGSFYILLGFFVAGLLHEFLPTSLITRHLGQERPRSVLLAALFGAPIPLCSCGVLPAAAALRRKGASRSALMAFLISTPETGVDSVALTWGLLGPLMAVVRPLVAIATGIAAGLLGLFVRDDAGASESEPLAAACHAHDHAGEAAPGDASAPPWRTRLRAAIGYGFGSLLDEIAFWLVVGLALTGLLAGLLPNDFFSSVLGWDRGLLPMLAMAAASVPLYLCASASTPVAAALIAKGLSPGAALVFLLVGPATNAATVAVARPLLGPRRLRIYLLTILALSLAAGFALDLLAADTVRASTLGAGAAPDRGVFGFVKLLAAVSFTALLAWSFQRTRFREGRRDAAEQMRALRAALSGFEPRSLLRPPLLATLVALALAVVVPRMLLIVEPGQRGIVQRFGRVVASDLGPGLHLHWPAPLGRGVAVDVDWVRQLTVGFRGNPAAARVSAGDEAYYLTADENLIDIRSTVNYRVRDPARFALGVENADALIGALARGVLVRIATSRSIDAIYATGRLDVEKSWREALARAVDAAGIGVELLDARLLDVHAPESVHDAFRDVASAVEDREREIHDANGYGAERRNEGAGESATLVEAARAEATRVAKQAAGDAAAFAGLASVDAAQPAVTEQRLWLEALERALAAPRKFIHAAHGDVDLWSGNAPPGSLPPLALPAAPPPVPPATKEPATP